MWLCASRRPADHRAGVGVSCAAMDLEPRTIETVGSRCEECGATLTPAELRAVLESGGPALCTVHAAEVEALPDPEDEA